jgi:hypothetical protein
LGDLEDRFNSLESGSKSMVSQVFLSAFLVCMIYGTEYLRLSRRRDWPPSKGRRLGLNLNRRMCCVDIAVFVLKCTITVGPL